MYFSGLRNQLLCAMLFSDANGFTQHILQGLAAKVLQCFFFVPGDGCNDFFFNPTWGNDPSQIIPNDLLIPASSWMSPTTLERIN